MSSGPIKKAAEKLANMQRYIHPANMVKFSRPVQQQLWQIYAQKQFDLLKYPNSHHEKLMKLMKYLSNTQKQLQANKQFHYWNDYLEQRQKMIPEQWKLNQKHISQIKDAILVAKARKIQKMQYQYARTFKFDIPIDPRLLLKIAHPHWGYLVRYPGLVSKEDLIQFYRKMTIASFQKKQKNDLLSLEMASFAFWCEAKKGGYMNLVQFLQFLKVNIIDKAFKFEILDWQSFKKQFQYCLKKREDEITSQQSPIRFDFFRDIFLERNL